MVASGRCDPPWVTLAECDLATAVNKPVPRVSVYLNTYCDSVFVSIEFQTLVLVTEKSHARSIHT